MLRRTPVRCLIDDPGAWARGLLSMKDELLLTDWNEQGFQAYQDCEMPWNPSEGFIRRFSMKGPQDRLYGQFAMKIHNRTPTYVWQPAIVDTGARATYLCKRTLATLGIDRARLDKGYDKDFNVMIGTKTMKAVITEDQATAVDGSLLDGDLNILGMSLLGAGVLQAIRQCLENEIGHPHTTVTWVQLVLDNTAGPAFMVTPTIHNIDGLKKAVKAEDPSLKDIAAHTLIVQAYGKEKGDWIPVTKASTPLVPNTEETAYRVILPKPHAEKKLG